MNLFHSLPQTDSFRVTAVESTEIGGAIGRIKADDPDVGRNAEMEYSIVGGHDMFNIITDQTTQEGVIVIKKVAYFCSSLPYIAIFYVLYFMSHALYPATGIKLSHCSQSCNHYLIDNGCAIKQNTSHDK